MEIGSLENALAKAIDALYQQLQQLPTDSELPFPYRLQQTLEAVAEQDLSDWLASQAEYPKFFWHSRDQQRQIAALGCAQAFYGQQALDALQNQSSVLKGLDYYWLSGFDSEEPDSSSPPPQLFLPQVELYQAHNRLELAVIVNHPADIAARMTQLRKLKPIRQTQQPQLAVSQRQDSPVFEQWQQAILDAKKQFNQGHLQKVVLARQSSFECQSSVDYWALFKRWQQASVNCYQIGYQVSANKGFISFTPERLFLRDGLKLTTEAVAATQSRSQDSRQAQQEARYLLNDAKSRHEHDLVVVEIGAKLNGLGVSISPSGGTQLLQLAGLQHLQQLIKGSLPRIDIDAQLLTTLHPTAAVGGLPTASARAFILEHEPLPRGLYAGCCGYISAQRTELAVTIRSADFDFPKLTLYAGAGIVPQSDPTQEWKELEQKIALPLSLLNQPASISQGSHVIHPSRLR